MVRVHPSTRASLSGQPPNSRSPGMSPRIFRERVAVSLLAAAVVVGAVLGVMTIRSFTQPGSTALAVQQGDVSGAQANASPASMPAAPGSGGATSSSGGGTITRGALKNGGVLAITRAHDPSPPPGTARRPTPAV